jgi:hypothetical protein
MEKKKKKRKKKEESLGSKKAVDHTIASIQSLAG